jgi:hypothetical protein
MTAEQIEQLAEVSDIIFDTQRRLDLDSNSYVIKPTVYFVTVEAFNEAGLCVASVTRGISVDTSPPMFNDSSRVNCFNVSGSEYSNETQTVGSVNVTVTEESSACGFAPILFDLSQVNSRGELLEEWLPYQASSTTIATKVLAIDIESPIDSYSWMITDDAGGVVRDYVKLVVDDLKVAVDVASGAVYGVDSTLDLVDGSSVCVVVKACNAAGLCSTAPSECSIVDSSPPSVTDLKWKVPTTATIATGNASTYLAYMIGTEPNLTFSFSGFSDAISGMKTVEVGIGFGPSDTDAFPYFIVSEDSDADVGININGDNATVTVGKKIGSTSIGTLRYQASSSARIDADAAFGAEISEGSDSVDEHFVGQPGKVYYVMLRLTDNAGLQTVVEGPRFLLMQEGNGGVCECDGNMHDLTAPKGIDALGLDQSSVRTALQDSNDACASYLAVGTLSDDDLGANFTKETQLSDLYIADPRTIDTTDVRRRRGAAASYSTLERRLMGRKMEYMQVSFFVNPFTANGRVADGDTLSSPLIVNATVCNKDEKDDTTLALLVWDKQSRVWRDWGSSCDPDSGMTSTRTAGAVKGCFDYGFVLCHPHSYPAAEVVTDETCTIACGGSDACNRTCTPINNTRRSRRISSQDPSNPNESTEGSLFELQGKTVNLAPITEATSITVDEVTICNQDSTCSQMETVPKQHYLQYTDAENDPVLYELRTPFPIYGHAKIVANNGLFTFYPVPFFHGTATVEYRVTETGENYEAATPLSSAWTSLTITVVRDAAAPTKPLLAFLTGDLEHNFRFPVNPADPELTQYYAGRANAAFASSVWPHEDTTATIRGTVIDFFGPSGNEVWDADLGIEPAGLGNLVERATPVLNTITTAGQRAYEYLLARKKSVNGCADPADDAACPYPWRVFDSDYSAYYSNVANIGVKEFELKFEGDQKQGGAAYKFRVTAKVMVTSELSGSEPPRFSDATPSVYVTVCGAVDAQGDGDRLIFDDGSGAPLDRCVPYTRCNNAETATGFVTVNATLYTDPTCQDYSVVPSTCDVTSYISVNGSYFQDYVCTNLTVCNKITSEIMTPASKFSNVVCRETTSTTTTSDTITTTSITSTTTTTTSTSTSTTTSTSSSSTTTTSNVTESEASLAKKKGLNEGGAAGVAITVLLIFALVAFLIHKKQSKVSPMSDSELFPDDEPGFIHPMLRTAFNGGHVHPSTTAKNLESIFEKYGGSKGLFFVERDESSKNQYILTVVRGAALVAKETRLSFNDYDPDRRAHIKAPGALPPVRSNRGVQIPDNIDANGRNLYHVQITHAEHGGFTLRSLAGDQKSTVCPPEVNDWLQLFEHINVRRTHMEDAVLFFVPRTADEGIQETAFGTSPRDARASQAWRHWHEESVTNPNSHEHRLKYLATSVQMFMTYQAKTNHSAQYVALAGTVQKAAKSESIRRVASGVYANALEEEAERVALEESLMSGWHQQQNAKVKQLDAEQVRHLDMLIELQAQANHPELADQIRQEHLHAKEHKPTSRAVEGLALAWSTYSSASEADKKLIRARFETTNPGQCWGLSDMDEAAESVRANLETTVGGFEVQQIRQEAKNAANKSRQSHITNAKLLDRTLTRPATATLEAEAKAWPNSPPPLNLESEIEGSEDPNFPLSPNGWAPGRTFMNEIDKSTGRPRSAAERPPPPGIPNALPSVAVPQGSSPASQGPVQTMTFGDNPETAVMETTFQSTNQAPACAWIEPSGEEGAVAETQFTTRSPQGGKRKLPPVNLTSMALMCAVCASMLQSSWAQTFVQPLHVELIEASAKIGQLTYSRFEGDLSAMVQWYDADGSGSLEVAEMEGMLSHAGVGSTITRPIWAAGILKSFDTGGRCQTPNVDGVLETYELENGFKLLGYNSSWVDWWPVVPGTHTTAVHQVGTQEYTAYTESPRAFETWECELGKVGSDGSTTASLRWPNLESLAAAVETPALAAVLTIKDPEECTAGEYEACMRQSEATCTTCYHETGCNIEDKLVHVAGSRFRGAMLLVAPGFTSVVEDLEAAAAKCSVSLFIVSGFHRDDPSSASSAAELAGQSVEFTVEYNNGDGNGACDVDCFKKTSSTLPREIACFSTAANAIADVNWDEDKLKLTISATVPALSKEEQVLLELAHDYGCFDTHIVETHGKGDNVYAHPTTTTTYTDLAKDLGDLEDTTRVTYPGSSNAGTLQLQGVYTEGVPRPFTKSLSSEHAVPAGIDATAPLMDAESQKSTYLSPYIQVQDVLSKFVAGSHAGADSSVSVNSGTVLRHRFYRAHPELIAGLNAVMASFTIKVNIVKFYQTASESDAEEGSLQQATAAPAPVDRYRAGTAARIGIPGMRSGAMLIDLAAAVIQFCAKRFRRAGFSLGLGLYADGVHVDMRYVNGAKVPLAVWAAGDAFMPEAEFQAWAVAEFKARKQFIPAIGALPVHRGVAQGGDSCNSATTLVAGFCCDKTYAITRLGATTSGSALSWCTKPALSDDTSVCPLPKVLPSRASMYFNSALATPVGPGVSLTETFCSISKSARGKHFGAVWARLGPKYSLLNTDHYKEEDTVKAHLENCLMSCDPTEPLADSTEGSIARGKYDSCNALVHWLPVKLADVHSTCHLASRSSPLKTEACFWGKCVEDTTLYKLLDPAPTFMRDLVQESPVDPVRGDPESLYGVLNPSPLSVLIQQLMAIECTGIVTVWISASNDFGALAPALTNLLAYNQAVTLVELHVAPDYITTVTQALANLKKSLLASSCRRYSREALTPTTLVATNDQRIPDPSQ